MATSGPRETPGIDQNLATRAEPSGALMPKGDNWRMPVPLRTGLCSPSTARPRNHAARRNYRDKPAPEADRDQPDERERREHVPRRTPLPPQDGGTRVVVRWPSD